MTTIEIFEPAGCCATSSVVIDQNALHFNADMDWCKQQGFEVKRHNLLKNPQSFISNPRVKEFLDVSGTQSLPVTLVTLGLFLFVINAITFQMASGLLEGFHVASFWDALLGSVLYSLWGLVIDVALERLMPSRRVDIS